MSDEFTFDTGLKEDWDGTIVLSRFEQQGRGNWALVLKSLADPTPDEPEGEEVDHRPLSVGGADKGWTSHDGGEEIMGATEKAKFHERSTIAQFIQRAMKAGAEDELKKRSRERFDKRGPMHAALWEGLRFHWDVETEKTQRQEDGVWKDVEVSVMVPVKYLGVSNGQTTLPLGASQAPNPSQTQTPQSSSPSANGGSPLNGELSDKDLATLKIIAMASEDHSQFADAVMDSEDASGVAFLKNAYVRKNLSKESWYQELKG